jgi:hypothetical protein
MNRICSIDLVSENGEEYIVFPLESIRYLEMKNINESVSLIRDGNGDVDKTSTAAYMAIGLNSDVLGLETNLEHLFLDWLHKRNIGQIYLNYDNRDSETFYCDWSIEDCDKNLYQENNFENEGFVGILISNHNNVKENIKC